MASDTTLAPDFIRFLISSKPKFDCYFTVGNESLGKPERIGAVKLMLMAHSEVFRPMLEDSELKEKGDVPVKDIQPNTFKEMLKYVYGHDTTPDMSFDEADDLLYLAEKYRISTLKTKLAVRLMSLLNPDNICSLLNNPACYRHLELDSLITKILRYETDRVLANPQFLCVNPDGFVKILEQDGLAVVEIQLWRSAIKWAKHRAVSEDGQVLRKQLSGLTQHLRLFPLNETEIVEVIPSGILTMEELTAASLHRRNAENTPHLDEFSNETEPRKLLMRDGLKEVKMAENATSSVTAENYSFTILTKENDIELLPLVCKSRNPDSMSPKSWTYKVDCRTTVTELANQYDTYICVLEPPISLSFSQYVKCGVEFKIPLTVDGRNVTLLPDTKYTITIAVTGSHYRYQMSHNQTTGVHLLEHLTLIQSKIQVGVNSMYYFPSTKLQYRVATQQ